MIVGVVGNVTVIIYTIFLSNEKTATSYLAGNLALADLLVSLTFYPMWIIEFIQTMLNIDSNQELFCKLSRSSIWSLLLASIGSLLAITVDKYFYIVKPLKHPEIVTHRRVFLIISGIWFTACCFFILLYLYFTSDIKLRSFCNIPTNISIFMNLLIYVPPIIILILNFQILRIAQKQRRRITAPIKWGSNDTSNEQPSSSTAALRQFLKTLKSIKTLLTIVILLIFCCFLPTIVGFVFYLDVCSESCQHMWYVVFQYELYGINSIVNAFIYGMRHVRYRKAYGNVIFKIFRCHSTNNN